MAKAKSTKRALRPKAKPKPKARQLLQNVRAVAHHFGVSQRTVFLWKSDGMPGGPTYDLEAIAVWRASRGRGTNESDNTASARKSEAQAQILELKLRKFSGELFELEPARRLITRQHTEAVAILNQFPQLMVSLLPCECPTESEWDGIRSQVQKGATQIVASTQQTICDLLTAKEFRKPEEQPACSS
jgi:phage terminase Nu1 subunit (DNA packaging protein)